MNKSGDVMSVKILFDRTASNTKNNKFLLYAPESISYGKVFKEISLIMRLFNNKGLKKGDIIVLNIENDSDLLVFYLAAFRYGLVIAILDVDATDVEVGALLQHIRPQAIICSKNILSQWYSRSLLEKNHLLLILGLEKRKASPADRLRVMLSSGRTESYDFEVYPHVVENLSPLKEPESEPEFEDFSMLVFTSGSTGTPKVIRLKYEAVVSQATIMARQLNMTKDTSMLSLIPFTSLGAAASGILLSFMNGSTLVRPVRKFSNQSIPEILDAVYSKRVTHFFLSPAMMQLILRYGERLQEFFDTEDFISFLSMSSNLPKKLWQDFEAQTGKEVINSYGLSEANNLTYSGPGFEHRNLETVGRFVNSRGKILDTEGREVAVGEVGELVVSGDTTMYDYFGDAAATEQAFIGEWFKTGDLARKTAEGDIAIVGRIKDVVIVGGNNVYPQEVDENIRLHPQVIDACSLGIEDDIMGEILVSCIVREDDSLSAPLLMSFLRERISPIKVPALVKFVDEIPMSQRGKPDRKQLRVWLSEELGAGKEESGASIEAKVISTAADTFMVEKRELDLSSNYSNTMGWDSLGHVMFVEALGRQFDVPIEPIDVLKIHTILDAVNWVESKLPEVVE